MDVRLDGRRAFVTAGASGIGRSIVEALRAAGAAVATCDIDTDALGRLPDDVERFECDVADSSRLDAVFDQVLPAGLDILVNNAGIAGPTKLVEDITDEEWRRCLAVCIDSQFYTARRVVPVFKQQQSGSMINLVSSAGLFGYPTRAPYAAAKWAVTGLIKTLAMELGPHGIRVNGVSPGNVNGDRMDRVIAAHAETEGLTDDEVRRMYSIGTSMQCYVDPSEIADLIVFLCSDLARHISGQIIGVDGHTETLWPRS